MPRRKLATAICAVAASLLAAAPAAAGQAPEPDPVVEMPVSFEVQNVNHSGIPCASDGKTYTVRGSIIAPESALESADAATLYLHAVTWGDYYFNFKGVEDYDFATQLAERGHVSVIIDRLGYGDTGQIPGMATCFGSEADVAHQIVNQLRSGDYTADDAVGFEQVFIGGSSVGGLTSNIVAWAFGNVDGVINFSWGDFAATPYGGQGVAKASASCLTGGEPGAPPNYHTVLGDSIERFYFNSAEPAVRAAVPPPNPDPCGQILSIPAAIGFNTLNLGQIDVPVLVSFGLADSIFAPQPLAGQQQAFRYTGSPDVTLLLVPDASHYPLVEANHLQVVDSVDAWLDDRAG